MYKADENHGAPTAAGLAIAASLVFAAVVLSRWVWWGNPAATTDEQLYALIGGALAQGELPYMELWDRKPFGLFAIFAAGEWIEPAPYGFQLLAGMFTLGGAWFTYMLARKQVDWVTSAGAALLYVILISLYGAYSGQSEVFHAPMMLAMAWLVLDGSATHYSRRMLIAMLIGGLALQVKYTVLPQCIFFGLVGLWHLHRQGFGLPRVAAMAAASASLGVLPTALVGLLYFQAGAFDIWWFSNFESFFLRDGAGRWLPGIAQGLMPIGALGICGAYLAFRGKPMRDPTLYTLFLGWTLAAIATVFWPGTVYLYYVGAMVAPVILVSLPFLDRKGPASVGPLLMAILATVILLGPWKDWRTARSEAASLEALAEQIAPLVDDDRDCMWIHDGPTALYTMSGSCLPTRFIYPDHLNNALETDAALGMSQTSEAMRILDQRPTVIVTSPEALTPQNADVLEALQAALAEDYEKLGAARSGYRDVIAYARKRSEVD